MFGIIHSLTRSFAVATFAVALPLGLTMAGAAAGPARDEAPLPKIEKWTGDLDGMIRRRIIRILVPYSKTIFFIDKGENLGTGAEWGDEFAEWINKGRKKEIERVRVVFVPTARDRLLPALNEGVGDIAFANLTVTKERLAAVDFTRPWLTDVREVLVTGPSAPAIATLADLSGKDLYLRASSSYYEHLVALNSAWAAEGRTPVRLRALAEDLEDEDILEMVNAGLLPFAVVDDHKARIWAKAFKALVVRNDIVVNQGGTVAPAIRKNSPKLKARVDEYMKTHGAKTDFAAALIRRYYGDDKMLKRAYAPEDMARFKQLVSFFRRYGDVYHFDHLMIAAQGYQESRLNQAERSRSGAVGIMQLLPSTAKEIEIKGVDVSAERNIEAGNKYLRYLIEKYLNEPGLDRKNQTLFAFAAYNAGPNNLKRFRDKARQMGLNPNVWFYNVENAAAAIIGRETVQYVGNIYKYYTAYELANERQNEAAQARDNFRHRGE